MNGSQIMVWMIGTIEYKYKYKYLENIMLVKLVSGASVNPDTLKHIYIEQKTISGKKT